MLPRSVKLSLINSFQQALRSKLYFKVVGPHFGLEKSRNNFENIGNLTKIQKKMLIKKNLRKLFQIGFRTTRVFFKIPSEMH